MKATEAQYRTSRKYHTKTYERIALDVRRDSDINGDYIHAHAATMGESMNSFINRAVTETIARDKENI